VENVVVTALGFGGNAAAAQDLLVVARPEHHPFNFGTP
jgi:hypothetical protein